LGKQVKVKVFNLLTSLFAHIHLKLIALQIFFFGDLLRDKKQFAHQFSVFNPNVKKRANVLFGGNENVKPGFGPNIWKHNELVVFVNDFCWYLLFCDFAKNAIHPSLLASLKATDGKPLAKDALPKL